ncbi:MAG: four helix bundle protein [Bacteroidaceae bacterium]|nr:four helix bundle protein [Bacteroidaceae bacterium]
MAERSPYKHEHSPLLVKSEKFAGRILNMVQFLDENKKAYKPILNQILRSGTSISANVGESQFAQTPADFITKLHISLKEANETQRWLNMLLSSKSITKLQHESMLNDLNEIISILVSSLKTIKKNNPNLK